MMYKNFLKLGVTALLVGSVSVVNAEIIDAFDVTTSGGLETSATSGGSWASLHYTGNGIYNDSTRLVAGRNGWSQSYSVSINPNLAGGTLTTPATWGAEISYGTGVKNWFDTRWANQQYGTRPSVAAADEALELNISATLTDSLYIDVTDAGSAQVLLFDSNSQQIAFYNGVPLSVGTNTIAFSDFQGLTASEAMDIDGISVNVSQAYGFQEIGFNVASVAAVPEPETYAMFLAGLGLLGFAARRKQA